MPHKILRLPLVIDKTGLSRSTIYLKVSKDEFPRPLKLGLRASGWIEEEIDQWLTECEKRRFNDSSH